MKQCPKCKEWIAKAATKCPRCQSAQPQPAWAVILGTVLVVLIGAWAVRSCGGSSQEAQESADPERAAERERREADRLRERIRRGGAIGKQCVLGWPVGGADILGAPEPEAWVDLVYATGRGDTAAIASLVDGGEVLMITEGTTAIIQIADDTSYRVQISSGEYAGTEVWVDRNSATLK